MKKNALNNSVQCILFFLCDMYSMYWQSPMIALNQSFDYATQVESKEHLSKSTHAFLIIS